MNCLCCGKPLREPIPDSGWHPSCIRRFFGTKTLPEIELTDEALLLLAEKAVQKGHTVPGVQKKLSLHLSTDVMPHLTIVDYPTGYILKPQVPEFQALPEAEHLVMQMAAAAGISVVPHALVRLKDSYAYLTRRIDRVHSESEFTLRADSVLSQNDSSQQADSMLSQNDSSQRADSVLSPSDSSKRADSVLSQNDSSIQMLAMEDFCQLDLRLTQDKYRGSYERCVKVIQRYSSRLGLDLSELFLRLVFCFLTGNSDMHLKNFSLLETAPESGSYVLSPAYDLLPVNVIMPEDPEEFALTMNGKKNNLRRKDFLIFAEAAGISRKAAEAMIRKMTDFLPKWLNLCEASLLPAEMKNSLSELMQARMNRLQNH